MTPLSDRPWFWVCAGLMVPVAYVVIQRVGGE